MLFEKIFIARPWKFLFVSSDDLIGEWRSRWSHDCYSFIFGMAFGLIICILKRWNFIDEYENNLSDHEDAQEIRDRRRDINSYRNIPSHYRLALIFISLVGLISYLVFAILCKSKENCDEFTVYISIIPVSNPNHLFIPL